ncbi:MAG: ribonuclease P protein component [Hydrotalea flava]|uniref:ribonuclease P protein component n=1 Tax=Hydrotalea TaxID=1004300 RepID=UPI0009444034|nr:MULTISPECIES: ribonuclease P protein component [Hydrotalea]MBY0347702.1 ribonuclease P protein component [Hydrotalea flava]NIM36605.1 ribonuclease P protein component [Hydrotalea flava]NIM39465.1 ribonuclease P protein component [Hydrotalea flava]NIN04654.1 ribonuclease P protein component [Hydrotalea flava]NIN16326.1 ribonuclease P protein component [Hydrotalea flava]
MSGLFSYSKHEKLKSRKQIEVLFVKGMQLYSYPFKILYQIAPRTGDDAVLKAGVTVSSRHFKKAVQRNRIKRLMREAYRLNKVKLQQLLTEKPHQLYLFIIYVGKEMPNQQKLHSASHKLLVQLYQILHEMDTKNT